MNANSFRRLALSFDGVVEGAHMSHPDFRANGRIFATIQPGERTGMINVAPDEQERLVRDHPTMFSPESGAWGRQGCTRVQLGAADKEVLGEAMTLAWQKAMRTPPPRKKARPRS